MNRHYHLIGIGGIGMSGIAQLLLRQGFKVSGSDLKENKITGELKELGADIFIGHNPLNIKGADLIVYSSAIGKDNPEIKEAKRQGIPLIKRAEALARLMKDEAVITVTGSHGKTTTASLVAYLLLEAGLSPTVAVGGVLRNIDTNACLGDGHFFVAEADESDGSFLYYRPKYSIITNIDYAHTEDALTNAIGALRQISSKKIIVVFGCGGERDKTKRPKMGRAASELADYVIITSDNPRSEDPQKIIEDIRKGIRKNNYCIISDRKDAIGRSLSMAGAGDIVLIAGKGHENCQILKDKTIHFDDREAVKECLESVN